MNADQVKTTVNKYLDQIDVTLRKNDKVRDIEQKLKVRPSLVAIGVAVFLILVVLFTFGGDALSNLIAFAYPMYETGCTLRSFKTEDVKQWLTYWQIVAFLELVESFLAFLVESIPGYFLIKIGFLVWCMLPETKGATTIYAKVLDPIINKFHSQPAAAAAPHAAASPSEGEPTGEHEHQEGRKLE